MDKATNNAMYAKRLSEEVQDILEQNASNNSWSLVNKLQLPPQSFLWIEDKEDRRKWHLPYREGAGGIDPVTKMYRRAGAVNLNALRAIDQAMGGSKARMPSIIPKEIKSKIIKLLKEFSIGKYSESRKDTEMKAMQISESTISGQFKEGKFDKENRTISGVIILNSTSENRYFPGSKGTKFSEAFLRSVAENIDGKKVYMNHASMEEMGKHHGVRDVKDILGFYENGRMENGVPRADIKYLQHQAPIVESLVGEMADKIGLSIVANGEMIYDKETGIAEAYSLKTLHSADLVTEPGSTNNMFESGKLNDEEESMDLKDLTLNELLENRPDMIEAIEKKVQDNLSSKDEVDSLKKQVTELTEGKKTLELKVDEFEVIKASAKKKETVDELLKESKIEEALVTPLFRETLSEAKDEAAMKALIEDRKTLTKPEKKKGVSGMGDHKDIDESNGETLSDEDYDKAVIEAANERR